MHYYTRHLGDYAKDTGHLSLLDHGVYGTLMDWQYATEKPLPEDSEAVYRICRAVSVVERRTVDRIVGEFFSHQGQRWNKRILLEIEKFSRKSESSRRAVEIRWQGDGNTNVIRSYNDGSATVMPRARASTNQYPITNNQGAQPVEIPSDAEVVQFGREWPGDMQMGIPAGLPEGWVRDWYAWRRTPKAGPFPADWQDDIARRARSAWSKRDPRIVNPSGAGAAKKNGGEVSASVQAIADTQRRKEAAAELRKAEEERDAYYQSGAQIPADLKARIRDLEREAV